MKKTLIALMALSGIASAALTEIANMDSLITSTTSKCGTATTAPGYDQTVYTLNGAYLKLSNSAVTTAMTAGSGVVYVAAWVYVDSVTANDYKILFSWGEDNKGFKFGLKGDDLCVVTKGQTEKVGNFSITKDTWTLIAVGYSPAADSVGENMFRIQVASAADGQMYTYKYKAEDPLGDNDMKPMTAPADNMFAIGSSHANKTSEGENFDGLVSDLTIFTSTGFESNSTIKAAMSAAPKLVPEPTTATLSLLALAGLAARRRRK